MDKKEDTLSDYFVRISMDDVRRLKCLRQIA